MKADIVYLNFSAPLRIGKKGIGEESTAYTIPSDTLFSAFINTYAKMFGLSEANNLVSSFIERKPPFIISSTFPYLITRDNRYVRLYPKPYIQPEYIDKDYLFLYLKKLKRSQYVSESLFKEMINKKISFIDILEKLDAKEIFCIGPSIIAKEDWDNLNNIDNDSEKPTLIVTKVLSHNTLDRLTNFSLIYFSGSVVFKDGGLFFLVSFIDNSFKSDFYATLNLLADEGIGGNRSIGYGRFEYKKVENHELTVATQPTAFMTLSRYIPTSNELESLKTNLSATDEHALVYRLVNVGGFVFSPILGAGIRRPKITLFSEGSIFPISLFNDSKVLGKTTVLLSKGEHKIVRYGLAYPLEVTL